MLVLINRMGLMEIKEGTSAPEINIHINIPGFSNNAVNTQNFGGSQFSSTSTIYYATIMFVLIKDCIQPYMSISFLQLHPKGCYNHIVKAEMIWSNKAALMISKNKQAHNKTVKDYNEAMKYQPFPKQLQVIKNCNIPKHI
ncbi:unnamed protein product [Lupinus luteus]|uniref:Uncharacterized protein n=1 Tax=Lupinus luteus TaxID=3873 RepID=A0AAV1W6Y2_LUPLU